MHTTLEIKAQLHRCYVEYKKFTHKNRCITNIQLSRLILDFNKLTNLIGKLASSDDSNIADIAFITNPMGVIELIGMGEQLLQLLKMFGRSIEYELLIINILMRMSEYAIIQCTKLRIHFKPTLLIYREELNKSNRVINFYQLPIFNPYMTVEDGVDVYINPNTTTA